MRGFWAGCVFVVGMSSTWAHLGAGTFSMTPEGPYKPKDAVTLKWTITVPHGGTDIEYSPNGGKSWTMVRKDFASGANGAQSFNWTIPDSATQAGMIRICQKQGTTGCTNADTISRPSSAPYTLVSRRFSITAAPVALKNGMLDSRIHLRETASGVFELNVKVETAGDLVVAAYDADGREVEILFTRRLEVGAHRLSFGSEALRAHPEWLVRMRLNGRDLNLQP